MHRTCLCIVLTVSLGALEVVGECPWLERTLRAEWRLAPLGAVLDEVAGRGEVMQERSPGAIQLAAQAKVALVATSRQPLRQVLADLEAAAYVHLTATPQRLEVRTWREWRDARRRPVSYDLRQYGIGLDVEDRSAPLQGLGRDDSGGGGSLFSATADRAQAGPEPMSHWLTQTIRNLDQAQREEVGAVLRLLLTPEEEAALTTALEEHARGALATTRWVVTSGILDPGQALTAGVVSATVARDLASRLHPVRRLVLTALDGQKVTATDGQERTVGWDVEIVSAGMDPGVSPYRSGLTVELRPTRGNAAIELSLKLSWIEPLASATTALIAPSRRSAGEVALTAKPGDAANASVTEGYVDPGNRLVVDLPAEWAWTPTCHLAWADGRALILTAPHPSGQAVILVEALP